MRNTGPDEETVQIVLVRDDHACVVCGTPVHGARGYDWSIQHRRPRGMGGSRRPETNGPANLLLVCGNGTTGCHGRMESDRVYARDQGWLVWSWQDPAEIPVLVGAQSRWVYLTSYGTYSDDPPEATA